MQRQGLVCLVVLLSASLAGCQAPEPGTSGNVPPGEGPIGGKADDAKSGNDLDVWTWNLERFPQKATAPETVADIILERGADIVGFQEITDTDAFDALVDQLPGWGGFPGRPGFATSVAIAYRRDAVRVTDIEDLFEEDSYAFPRPPLAVTFELRDHPDLGELTIVVVHLKARIDSRSETRRREGVRKLEQWIYERRMAGRGAVLAIGDWNDEIGDSRSRNVFLPFLDRPNNYVSLTEELDDNGEFSFVPFERLIDHGIATREMEERFPALDVDVLELDMTVEDYLRDISDHRPVRSVHALQ